MADEIERKAWTAIQTYTAREHSEHTEKERNMMEY
jgi:hypothetical protein